MDSQEWILFYKDEKGDKVFLAQGNDCIIEARELVKEVIDETFKGEPLNQIKDNINNLYVFYKGQEFKLVFTNLTSL